MKLTPSPFPVNAAVVAYIRDSGGEEQDLSVAGQEAAIRAWCAEHSLHLYAIYVDAAAPGSSTSTRRQFLSLIHDLQTGLPVAGLVVWRSNRLGRNLDDMQYYSADLRRRGYIIHSLTDPIPGGSAGRLVEFALQWKDQIFLEQLSEDVRRGLGHIVRQYGAVPGTPPRGFRRVSVTVGNRRNGQPHILHRWEPDPEQAPLVRLAFEMRVGGATLRQIAQATGLYKSVNCWCTFFVNPIYKGVLHYGDQIIPDYCDPIVPPALWEAAQTSTPANPRRAAASPLLLSGLLRCAHCGGAMVVNNGIENRMYYECSRRHRSHDCPARNIPAAVLDDAVVDKVLNELATVENLISLQAEVHAQADATQAAIRSRRAELESALSASRRAIANLVRTISETGGTASLVTALRERESESAALELELAATRNLGAPAPNHSRESLTKFYNLLKQAFTTGDVQTRRAVLAGFVLSVTVKREGKEIAGEIEYIPPIPKTQAGGPGFLGLLEVPPGGHRHKPKIAIYSATIIRGDKSNSKT